MTWLILIVRLSRAAPRHRTRVYAELEGAGGVGVSEGVWALPDTDFHREALEACSRRAIDAGGDIIVLRTSSENSSTHDVLEAALAERLTADADSLFRKYLDFTQAQRVSGPARDDALRKLQLDAGLLSRRDVLGLEVVGSIVTRVEAAAL